MATNFQGLSVAPLRDKLYQANCNTAGLVEGAAVVHDTGVAGGRVKAPTGAAVSGFAGLITDILPSGGTVAGHDVNLQRTGRGMGLLKAGDSVNVGDRLVVAGTDGSLRAFNDGVDANCDIVGKSLQTLTAGSNNDPILVDLDAFSSVA